jgi:hypothetical protein
MIPLIPRTGVLVTALILAAAAATADEADAPSVSSPGMATPGVTTPGVATPGSSSTAAAATAACLPSGDGYLRARVAGAIDAKIDWPNSGTRCQGESKSAPPGVRLSFQRAAGSKPDLLFVFGLTGVRPGQPGHAVGANLTVIVQGTNKIFGTLGDSRCTVDTLMQKPLQAAGAYRVEARGFCTQPAHAVRGNGAVLVSTFEFAGLVNYETDDRLDTAGVDAPGVATPGVATPAQQ